MKIRLHFYLLIIALISLVGCSPSPDSLQKAVEQTVAALPTNTSVPTPLPTITSVPTPGISQIDNQEWLYIKTMTPLIQKFTNDYQIVNSKTQEMALDVKKMLDTEYKYNYYADIDSVFSDLNELSLVPAPSSFSGLPTLIKNGKTEWDLFRTNIRKGLNDLDVNSIDIAKDHYESFARIVVLMASDLEKGANQTSPEIANAPSEQILGTWYDTWASKRTITITKIGDKYKMKEVYSDGSNQTITLGVKAVGGETRLFDTVNAYGDYMVVKSNGNLAFYDNQGFIYEIKP